MSVVNLTAFDLAQRFVGLKEVSGAASNPQVVAMLRLDATWPGGDDVPWCSAFVNYVAWLLRLPRSKSLTARSWLSIGVPVQLQTAIPGFDVVILKRAGSKEGPEVVNAPGHVGFFGGFPEDRRDTLYVLGGNQSDSVSLARFPIADVLGVRRLLS